MKKISHLIMGGALFAITATCESQATQLVHSFVPKGTLQDEQSFGDYVVRTYRTDERSFQILRKGIRVHAEHGFLFRKGGNITTLFH